MSQNKALTDEKLLGLFDDIGDASADKPSSSSDLANKPRPKASNNTSAAPVEDVALAELAELAKAKPASRPHTPKQGASLAPSRPRVDAATPSSTGSARTSEERAVGLGLGRRSGESSRSYHQAFTPASTNDGSPSEDVREVQQQEQQSGGGGGGWLGGLWSTASAVRKQAEAAVHDIRNNEEAQKWAQGVMKGKLDVGALTQLGADLRTRALPTFTTLLHTLAPPISQHERLLIHTTHDMLNYPTLDPTIYAVFSRVMAQVEGGDLLVLQRGSESTPKRRSSSDAYRGPSLGLGTTGGWTDGPWWRQGEAKRDVGLVHGLAAGRKLAKVSAETYGAEFYAARGAGGLDEAQKQAATVASEDNPTRSSDIFLALQAVSFGGGGAAEGGEDGSGDVAAAADDEPLFCFALHLHDPIHALSFATLSQSFPLRWMQWLDAQAVPHPERQGEFLPPDDIAQIIEEGGVDPREWVSEWVEEALSIAVGVVAQRYVARRMGVGEGGIGLARRRETIEAGAGEAARAVGGL